MLPNKHFFQNSPFLNTSPLLLHSQLRGFSLSVTPNRSASSLATELPREPPPPSPMTRTSIFRIDCFRYPSDDTISMTRASRQTTPINLSCLERTAKRSAAPRESLQAALDLH
ncbi:hypothetical protein TNCV_2429871 [Trichonephila clavipes]|nr:hypothetical protein TNCV_2429871 [Trichonephila clavipes]